jgi:hypothetical protein
MTKSAPPRSNSCARSPDSISPPSPTRPRSRQRSTKSPACPYACSAPSKPLPHPRTAKKRLPKQRPAPWKDSAQRLPELCVLWVRLFLVRLLLGGAALRALRMGACLKRGFSLEVRRNPKKTATPKNTKPTKKPGTCSKPDVARNPTVTLAKPLSRRDI